MSIDMSLVADIKRHEGFVAKPYRDSRGILTVGYGYNLEKGMSEKTAELLLISELALCYEFLENNLDFWDKLTKNRQHVFLDMCYNLGFSGFMKFKRMIACASDGDISGVCREMQNSAWYGQVGRRAVELVNKYRIG